MAWRIFKYSIGGAGSRRVAMPGAAKVLSVQTQHDSLFAWALVDDNRDAREYEFLVLGTGHKLPDDIHRYAYAGTVQMDGGALVWHVFTNAEVVK